VFGWVIGSLSFGERRGRAARAALARPGRGRFQPVQRRLAPELIAGAMTDPGAGATTGAHPPYRRVSMSDGISVDDVPGEHRFELRVDGELAGHIDYRKQGRHLALVHTEVSDAFGGRGLGSRLVAGALDQVRARGGSVLPVCPFVRTYSGRHKGYLELVPADRRADFDLPAAPVS
jgi:uncharacterized protein